MSATSNLILNVSPNREGLFDQNAIDRLAEIGRLWQHPGKATRLSPSIEITTPNLAHAQPSSASRNQLGIDSDLAVDNDFQTYWVTEDDKTRGWLEVNFREPTRFNTVALVEPRYLADIVSGSNPATCQFHRLASRIAQRVRLNSKRKQGAGHCRVRDLQRVKFAHRRDRPSPRLDRLLL